MSDLPSMIRMRRQSLGSRPGAGAGLPPPPGRAPTRSVSRFFGRRSASVTEQMIRSVVEKMNKSSSKKVVTVLCHLPDDTTRWLSGEHGTRVSELVADVVMEHKLTSYRVHLASSKAILNLEADAMLLDGDEIILEDGDDDHNNDPRSEADSRLRTAYKLLKTEKRYQEALRSIFDVYAEPLRKFSSLTKDDHRVLFFGLEPLLSLSAMLVLKLEDSIQQWDAVSTIGNLFSKQFWIHYDEYYHNYKDIRSLLKEKRESDEEFVQFCHLRRGAAQHSLESLLLLPVQRIPAYAGYLSDLLEDTERQHPDYDDLSRAAAKVKAMVKEREEDLNIAENELKVETVQDRFPYDDLGLRDREKYIKMKALQSRRRSAPGAMILRTLSKKQSSGSSSGLPSLLPDLANASKSSCSNQNRAYVLEGPAQLTTGLQTQDRYLFLFSDLLLIAKQKSSTTFKLKQRTRVCEMWLADCLDEVAETSRSPERSFVLGWPTTNMVATFSTQETKDLWFTKLKEHIASEKEKEQPKTVILRVLNNDMEEYPTSKSLAVTNYEQTQEVVKRCMEEFHIADGKPKDYQLWVLSGKEESPYPLIGHEQPYSIKMSHVRDATRGPEDGPIDVDANDNSIQCQFVLRQAKKDPKGPLDEPGIKRTKKSKKSPLINFFKKSIKHDSTTTPTAPVGKLFGHSLCEVSQEDAIPKPIMAMLHHLFLNGPYTSGIFRKSANQRCLRELREKLDNEEEINFEEVPVLSIAGIFKEFLRSLPDCLLLSDMYDSWIDILEIQDNRQRVEKVKKTLELLPKVHVNLLRYIMCMLYHIDVRSDKNQMNASNLAICIGQSLLFPPASSGTPNQTGTKKVSELVQFMIEHVVDTFGEDVTLLFGEPPETKPRQDSSTDSDSMHSLLSLADNNGPRRDDSSLDSLDRDMYNSEIESSPRLLKSHMSNTNLSRDSGLTLSDTQLYTDDGSEGNEYPQRVLGTSPAKQHQLQQHYGRSVSQMDESHHHHHMVHHLHQQKMATSPEMLSRSCDGTLDMVDHLHPPPVPPPRKNRRRGAETPPGEQSPGGSIAGIPGPGIPGQGIRHTVSTSQMATGYPTGRPHPSTKGGDLLVNLEEQEATAEEYGEIQRMVQTQESEGAFLHKSESGAALYMDNELVHRGLPVPAQQQSPSFSLESPGQTSWADEDSPMRQVPDLSASYSGLPGSPMASPGMELSSSYPNLNSQGMMYIPDHPPPPYNANHKTVPTPSSQPQQVLDGSQEQPGPPLPPRPNSLPLQHPAFTQMSPLHASHRDSSISPPSTAALPTHSKKILRNQFPKDPTMLRKVQKGMTPTGADIFPKHMRNMMRHSLQEEEMRKVVVSKDRLPVHKQASVDSYQRPDSQPDRKHVLMHLRQARSVEKSASDSSILDSYQPGQESSGRKVSDSSVERRRPEKPPSYQEAIKRKSLIQSGALAYQASETELLQQRQNNMRARQLYEESMRRYQEEHKESPVPSSGKHTVEQPAPFSSLSQEAAEQIYETMTYSPEKCLEAAVQPPAPAQEAHVKDSSCSRSGSIERRHSEQQQQQPAQQDPVVHMDNRDIHCSNNSRRAAPSNGVSHRKQYSHSQDPPQSKSDSRESAPVRRNHSHERTSRDNRNNNQNERPKSRSKSREKRHGHRSSDTRLENSRSKEDRELSRLRSNLSRSKSDSQEHLNKIAKFKELKPLDNNIIEKCKRAKIEDFQCSLDLSGEDPPRRIQSVKHKDWHRELAEKYNQVFYQPDSVQPNKTVPVQYAYIKSTKQEANENERPKRRWTPPIHPSKDLIIKNEGEVRTRKNTPPRTIVKSENDFRNGQQYENARKNHLVAEKENRPAVPEPSPPHHTEGGEQDKDFTMGDPNTISWSVARLRNLYDDGKSEGGSSSKGPQGPFYSPDQEGSRPPPPPYRHPPPANRAAPSRRTPSEKTNPEAEESYV